MNRKKIAILANGWSPEFDQLCLNGIRRYSEEKDIDVHIFLSYASEGNPVEERNGDMNIFYLPDLTSYDGIIVLGNTFCSFERDELPKILKDVTCPVISLEYDFSNLHYLGSDNYSGMYELAEHIFRDHNVKDFLYISGPHDNVESQERLRAVADVAQKYMVSLSSDNLLYGDFSFFSAVGRLNDYLAIHDHLPRAIMCANDAMAIGLCEKLSERGYNIPKDVIVTGFDALDSALTYYPSISTVERNWEEMGYQAASFILEEADSYKEPMKKIIHSSMTLGESCGCTLCQEKAEARLIATKSNGRIHSVNVTFDMHLRIVYDKMRDTQDETVFHDMISDYITRTKEPYETDTFCMCLDPNFFVPHEDMSLLKSTGFAEKMHTCVNLTNGNDFGILSISPKQLYPKNFETEHAQVLIFIPMHIKGRSIGYSIFHAEKKHLHEYSLYIWSRHLFQNFEQIHQNIQIRSLTEKLTSLSVTDGLTGLYNRTGCIKLTIPYYEESIWKRHDMALIMCDVDGMKEINDTYGHLQGDLAISTVGAAIKESIPSDWQACRYGGDEFLIAGRCKKEEDLQNMVKLIEENVTKQAKKAHLPYKLIASVGGKLIHPEPRLSFEAALKLADTIMYDIKGQHKALTGGSIR